MGLFLQFVGIQFIFSIVLALKCYECNIYEDQGEGACGIVDCPSRYNHCINATYTPVADISSRECYQQSDKGQSYRGTWHESIGTSGCMNWLKANLTYNPTSFPGIGLGDHNHCRNPDGDVRPWCYTSENEDFGFCTLPKCFKHQVKVVELSCGWLSKSYCVEGLLGEECKEVCDTDLCHKPAFVKEYTTAGPTSSMSVATTSLRSAAPTNSTTAARPIERGTKAESGQSQQLSDGNGGNGNKSIVKRPQTIMIFTGLLILKWLNVAD